MRKQTLLSATIASGAIFTFLATLIAGQIQEATEDTDAAAVAVEEQGVGWGLLPLRGVELPVRTSDAPEVTDKTYRVAAETYFDADYGTLVYATNSGQVAALSYPPEFVVSSLAVDGAMESIKVNRFTGEAWRLNGLKWEPIPEDSASKDSEPTAGQYVVQIVASEQDAVYISRVDQLSGRVWFFINGVWRETTG